MRLVKKMRTSGMVKHAVKANEPPSMLKNVCENRPRYKEVDLKVLEDAALREEAEVDDAVVLGFVDDVEEVPLLTTAPKEGSAYRVPYKSPLVLFMDRPINPCALYNLLNVAQGE